MFETHYDLMPELVEFPFFVLLGAVGGIVGAIFVNSNLWVSTNRADGTPFRKRVHIVLEVALIAFITAVTSYPLVFTRDLSVKTIRALFQDCRTVDADFDMMGLCEGQEPAVSQDLLLTLAAAAVLRIAQCAITFGTGVPAGLFVPSLFTGACLGRIVGLFVYVVDAQYYDLVGKPVLPGVYAMVGAAAMLGGVCRVTISLVVIMFGLTGGLQLLLPFMLAVLTAKFVGDAFSDGIYDAYIVLRGYPYLHEPHEVCFKSRACDIMDDELECLNQEAGTLGELLETLRNTSFGGFPLVVSAKDTTLLGYVHAKPLLDHLENEMKKSPLMRPDLSVSFKKRGTGLDLSQFVDEAVMRVVPETPLAQVHNIFRQLGVKLVLVARFGHLAGLITKKSFVHHLQEGHIGHVAKDPVVEGIVVSAGEGSQAPNEAVNASAASPLLCA